MCRKRCDRFSFRRSSPASSGHWVFPAFGIGCRKGKGGRFGSEDFRYDAQDDTYVCPAGQRLVRDCESIIASFDRDADRTFR